MNLKQVERLLKQYDINEDELEDLLYESFNSLKKEESSAEPEPGDDDYDCKKASSFDRGIPDCRKVFEIWMTFYKANGYTKIKFAKKICDIYNKKSSKQLSLDSFIRIVGCKGCEEKESGFTKKGARLKQAEINNMLKDILCNGLDIKLKQDKLFNRNITIYEIDDFKKHLVPETKDNFIAKIDKDYKEEEMKKEEKDRLFDVIHVTREEFKNNLSDSTKTSGSDEYKLNLALYAFERGLDEESLKFVEILKESQEVKNTTEYLQLKAKLLSNFKRDKEAIETLETLINEQKPSIDVETHNLLAASIKRYAFEQYKNKVISEIQFKKELSKAKDMYSAIFNINKNYYPAINIIYLELMLVDDSDVNNIQKTIEDAQSLWDSSDIKTHLKEKDWWSFISDIEFSVLMTDYDKVFFKLKNYLDSLDEEVISEFSISSTIRQLELYKTYSPSLITMDLDEFIVKLKDRKALINE